MGKFDIPAKSVLQTDEERILGGLDDHLLQLREKFTTRLLTGSFTDREALYGCAELLRIPKEDCLYFAIAAVPVASNSIIVQDLRLYAHREALGEFALEKGMRFFSAVNAEEQLAAFFCLDTATAYESIRKELEERISSAEEECCVFSIGPAVDRLELVRESYQLAETNIKQMLQTPGYMHLNNHPSEHDEIQKYLLELFQCSDMDGIDRAFRNYVGQLHIDIPGHQMLVERFVVLYLQNITNECMRLGITLERFENYVPAVVSLMQRDIVRAVESVLQLTDQILKYVRMHRTNETNHLLNMAKDYIRDNLGNEHLDLEAVSDHVGLSRVYFCKLFHQLEGINFAAYLKKVRIEKAKHLLLTTNMKVYEVSNAVGYSHAKYFGHVFKEVVGQTPADYQRNAHAAL